MTTKRSVLPLLQLGRQRVKSAVLITTEFMRRPKLDCATLFHDEYVVTQHDRRDPVRNDDHRRLSELFAYRTLHNGVRLAVHRRRCFVHNDYGCATEEDTCQADELPLCACVCIYVWLCMRSCVQVSMCVDVCVCMCVCIYVYVYIYIYIYICTHTHTYMYRCICMHIRTHTHTSTYVNRAREREREPCTHNNSNKKTSCVLMQWKYALQISNVYHTFITRCLSHECLSHFVNAIKRGSVQSAGYALSQVEADGQHIHHEKT